MRKHHGKPSQHIEFLLTFEPAMLLHIVKVRALGLCWQMLYNYDEPSTGVLQEAEQEQAAKAAQAKKVCQSFPRIHMSQIASIASHLTTQTLNIHYCDSLADEFDCGC